MCVCVCVYDVQTFGHVTLKSLDFLLKFNK